jgi:hypothetical protein
MYFRMTIMYAIFELNFEPGIGFAGVVMQGLLFLTDVFAGWEHDVDWLRDVLFGDELAELRTQCAGREGMPMHFNSTATAAAATTAAAMNPSSNSTAAMNAGQGATTTTTTTVPPILCPPDLMTAVPHSLTIPSMVRVGLFENIPTILYVIILGLLNPLFLGFARQLTNIESHILEDQYHNSLLQKACIFSLLNSMAYPIYVI